MIRSLGHDSKVTGHVMDQVLILVAEDAGKRSLCTHRVDTSLMQIRHFCTKKMQINGVIQNVHFFFSHPVSVIASC